MNYDLDIKPFNDIPYNSINNNTKSYDYDIVKEEKCASSSIGTVCSYTYKTIYKNEFPPANPPYSIDKSPSKNIDLNLRQKSLNISCARSKMLEEKYNDNNEKDLLAILNNINDPIKPINYNYVQDLQMLRGNKVHYKSCNIKPHDYSDGKWITQHNNDVKNSIDNNLFNINKKRKTN